MKKEIESKKMNDWGITPCDVIFNHVSKPDGYMFCRSINVYDDRWRVNLYSKCERHGIDSKFISNSYFVSFNKDSGNMAVLS